MLAEPLVFACDSEEEKHETLVNEAFTFFSAIAFFYLIVESGEEAIGAEIKYPEALRSVSSAVDFLAYMLTFEID